MVSDRCLCGLMHVKTGTWIIAIIHLIAAILLVVESVLLFIDVSGGGSKTETKISYGIQAVLMILWLVVVIVLIMGLRKDRASYILPHWIISAIVGVWMIVQLVLTILSGTGWALIVQYVVIILVILYLLYVEYCCYQWMKGTLPV